MLSVDLESAGEDGVSPVKACHKDASKLPVNEGQLTRTGKSYHFTAIVILVLLNDLLLYNRYLWSCLTSLYDIICDVIDDLAVKESIAGGNQATESKSAPLLSPGTDYIYNLFNLSNSGLEMSDRTNRYKLYTMLFVSSKLVLSSCLLLFLALIYRMSIFPMFY